MLRKYREDEAALIVNLMPEVYPIKEGRDMEQGCRGCHGTRASLDSSTTTHHKCVDTGIHQWL